ncbi:hypothetical protein BHE74_00002438, partial [Ensete ventricosum]
RLSFFVLCIDVSVLFHQDKLAYFRIKELKDVLTQLGLAKQGKKQDLVNRILQLLSDDQGSHVRFSYGIIFLLFPKTSLKSVNPSSVPKSQVWGKRTPFWKDEVAKIIDDIYR